MDGVSASEALTPAAGCSRGAAGAVVTCAAETDAKKAVTGTCALVVVTKSSLHATKQSLLETF